MIRKSIVQILAVFMLLPAVVAAADGPPGSREEQEKALVELEKQRSYAIWKTDLETLDRIYAEDFRGLLGNGQFTDKAGFMGRNAKGDLVMHSRFTHVWVWRDGRWQVVEGANTPMPRE